MKLLIAGDSFAAYYPQDTDQGWPRLLSKLYQVSNVAQAGVGEYKILKQITDVNVSEYDRLIIAHTSPYRVHTRTSIHDTDLHKDCDLLISDIQARTFTLNPKIKSAQGYFKHHFDSEYYLDIYKLIRKEIYNVTKSIPTLHIDHFDAALKFATENHCLDLTSVWSEFKGKINHYTPEGNKIAFAKIQERLKNDLV